MIHISDEWLSFHVHVYKCNFCIIALATDNKKRINIMSINTVFLAPTDLNTWIAGSHGFAYSSMRATGNPSAAILLQSKHWIDTLTSAHVSAWNATGDKFLASNLMKILKKIGKVPQIFKTLRYLLKIAKKICWY